MSFWVVSSVSALFAISLQPMASYMNVVITGSVHKIIICDRMFYLYLSIDLSTTTTTTTTTRERPKALFTAGRQPFDGGSVDVVTALLLFVGCCAVFNAVLLYRITAQLQKTDQALGSIMQNLFKKLESLPEMGEIEGMNPLQAIITQFIQSKMNESTINRDDVGQFTRAEVIPPD